MPDLQAVVRFKPGPGRADSDTAYGARLMAVPMTCHLDTKNKGKDQSIDISGKLAIKAQRTDTLTTTAEVTYFVAIVNRSNTILGKRDFTLDLKFSGDKQQIEITDELHFVIPLAAGTSGADYAILVGFQVTPQELEYNRAHLTLPGTGPASGPAPPPGLAPGSAPGSLPGFGPGLAPGSAPAPSSAPGYGPGLAPGKT
jgi:hypothetical protein